MNNRKQKASGLIFFLLLSKLKSETSTKTVRSFFSVGPVEDLVAPFCGRPRTNMGHEHSGGSLGVGRQDVPFISCQRCRRTCKEIKRKRKCLQPHLTVGSRNPFESI